MFFLTLLNLCAYGGAKGGGAAFNRVLKNYSHSLQHSFLNFWHVISQKSKIQKMAEGEGELLQSAPCVTGDKHRLRFFRH